MTKFELMIASTYGKVIKSGRPADAKAMLELMDKYGAIPKADEALEAKIASDLVMEKINKHVERQFDINPRQREIMADIDRDECKMVLNCPHCVPKLRAQWLAPERKALTKDLLTTRLQSAAEDLKRRAE